MTRRANNPIRNPLPEPKSRWLNLTAESQRTKRKSPVAAAPQRCVIVVERVESDTTIHDARIYYDEATGRRSSVRYSGFRLGSRYQPAPPPVIMAPEPPVPPEPDVAAELAALRAAQAEHGRKLDALLQCWGVS